MGMAKANIVVLAIAVLAATLVTLASVTTVVAEPTLPSGFDESVVLGGLNQPTNVEFSEDGRVFVPKRAALSKSTTTSRTSNQRYSPTSAPRYTTIGTAACLVLLSTRTSRPDPTCMHSTPTTR
jgi:hypothetical protein